MIQAQFSETIAVNDVATMCTCGLDPGYLILTNDGPNAVYVQLDGTPATVAESFPLKKNETLTLTAPPASDGLLGEYVGLVCNTSETASVRVLALRT